MRLYRPATPRETAQQHAAQAVCEDEPMRPIKQFSDIVTSADDPRLVTPVVMRNPKRDRAEYMRGYRAKRAGTLNG